MRSLLLALLLSLTALALAQSNTAANNASSTQSASVAPTLHHHVAPRARYEDQSDDGTCYTMRTYYFERQDGNAPELKGMSTCTRTSQRDLKRAERDHPPRLIPAAR